MFFIFHNRLVIFSPRIKEVTNIMHSKIVFFLLFVLFFSAMTTTMIFRNMYETDTISEKYSSQAAKNGYTAFELIGDGVGGGFPCGGNQTGNQTV
jgi:hypothetical protein